VSEQRPASVPQVVNKWIGVVGLFVAPTTVITAICFYFGHISYRRYLGFFGVDSGAISFATSDYVLRSVSVLYPQMILMLAGWVAVLWAGAYLRQLTLAGQRTELIRAAGWGAILLGASGITCGIVALVVPTFPLGENDAATPAVLGVGCVVLLMGMWMLRASESRSTPATFASVERVSLAVVGAVIVLCLFWFTNIRATTHGETDAKVTVGKLWARDTSVVLDTAERLLAPSNLVKESGLPVAADSDGLRYRYECFRTLIVRGDRWVLVPARWTAEDGYAAIVDMDGAHRISLTRLRGIDDTYKADWNKSEFQCPEVVPNQ
jgi:hypothetical protein